MEIQGEGFILRKWRLSDAESLAKHINNITIWENLRDALPHPYTYNDAVTFINIITIKPELNDFAIIINNEAVGNIGIVPKTDIERISAEVGYWVAEPYWGKGITSKALKLVTEYVFANTSLQKIFATPFEHNIGSMRVLEKVGFEKEGVLRKAAIKNGVIIDLHYYGLIKV